MIKMHKKMDEKMEKIRTLNNPTRKLKSAKDNRMDILELKTKQQKYSSDF